MQIKEENNEDIIKIVAIFFSIFKNRISNKCSFLHLASLRIKHMKYILYDIYLSTYLFCFLI